MMKAKLRRIGDEVVVALPEGWLKEARLGDGDDIAVRVTDGELILTAPADRRELLMRFAREGMDEYAEALAELAK